MNTLYRICILILIFLCEQLIVAILNSGSRTGSITYAFQGTVFIYEFMYCCVTDSTKCKRGIIMYIENFPIVDFNPYWGSQNL